VEYYGSVPGRQALQIAGRRRTAPLLEFRNTGLFYRISLRMASEKKT
jgi:hypothetical protein